MTIGRKIGLHVFGARYGGNLGQPTVIKTVDPSLADVATLRARTGEACLIIVRWYSQDQPLDDPEVRAEEWFVRHASEMAAMDGYGPLAYTGYNEIADSQAAAYACFEVRRLELMHVAGHRAVVGEWSVGVPGENVWPIYAPVLAAMRDDDLVGLHEYWSDSADLENRWHVGRFGLPQVAPYLEGRRIVITECGRDYTPDTGQGRAGWKHTCDARTYLADLQRAGEIYDGYPQVLGATVYQCGSLDSQWSAFDVRDIWPEVVASYAAQETVTSDADQTESRLSLPVLPIDGRQMDGQALSVHLESIDLSDVRRVVIHHTAAPDEDTWNRWGGWWYWRTVLQTYYENKGWDKGPHLFVDDDGMGLFYDLAHDGRAVGGGTLETGSRHIEIVGNYSDHLPGGETLKNAVKAAALLLHHAGLDLDALTYHRELVSGGTACPGDTLVANWRWFRELVNDELAQMQDTGAPYLPHVVETGVTDPATVLEKTRWWLEEMQRQFDAGDTERAAAIRLSLITWMYARENALKSA